MAELGARERAKLLDSAFAYIDSAGRRRLPIHDEAHVRNALARFNRILFEDEGARDRARTRLLKAAKRHRIVPVGFIEGQLRPKLPTGQLTLLFADIESSSQLLAQMEDRYGSVLSSVRRLERASVQRAMREHAWPGGRDVRVRIGLHTGRPTLTASGYQGISVNAASRICSCGHGGQILVSRGARAAPSWVVSAARHSR